MINSVIAFLFAVLIYLVNDQCILTTGLLWLKVKIGLSKFLVSQIVIMFSKNDAKCLSFCGWTLKPYTVFVKAELTTLLASKIKKKTLFFFIL